jgi:hypothetical protein
MRWRELEEADEVQSCTPPVRRRLQRLGAWVAGLLLPGSDPEEALANIADAIREYLDVVREQLDSRPSQLNHESHNLH